MLSGGMVACTSWFFLDLACTWSYISHSAFSTVSSSINSKESRNHDYFTVLVLAFGFVQSTKIFSQWLKITSKSLNFMTERAKRAPLIFKDFAPKMNIFYFLARKFKWDFLKWFLKHCLLCNVKLIKTNTVGLWR